jgi:competence protein ComEC
MAALAGLFVPVALAWAVCVVAALAAVACAWRVRGRFRWLSVALLLGVVCGSAACAGHVMSRDAEPLASLVRARASVDVELVVTDDPRLVGARTTYAVPARLTRVDAVRIQARILVLASEASWRALLPGQTVVATGRLVPSRGGDLRAAVLSVGNAPTSVEAPPTAQRLAGGLRAGLQRACEPLPDEPGGLLPGLVVGDTSRLDPGVEDDFRATGMTHLTAVSGANCAIVIGAVMFAVRWLRAGPRTAAALSAAALVGFVILARPSPSVLRAAAMCGLALIALAAGRPRAAMPALATAIVVLIVVDPELAGDAGFALSVVATCGLLLLAPRWADALRARGVPAPVADALAVPAAAQTACAPVVAAISATVSLTAVPANLLAVPAVAPATLLGVGSAVLSPVWADGAAFTAWLGSWPARWLVWIAHTGADVPSGLVPWPGGTFGGVLLGAILAALLVAARVPWVRRVVLVACIAAVAGAAPVRLLAPGWPAADWLAVACDVGQGDALVLNAGPGLAIVVDAGPEPAAVDRCLRRLDVSAVALLVLSHFHADHTGGVTGVLRNRNVGSAVVPAYPEPALGRSAALASIGAAGVPVMVANGDTAYEVGDVGLTVVGPREPLHGTRSDPNNNSVVVRAVVRGGVSVLLPGDAEGEQQRTLLDAGVRADVMKLAHHGSAYQEPAFLDAVGASVVLVSVGAGNGYGHPNGAVLDRLARGGARIARTDEAGDVAVTSVGGRLAVVARGREPGT